MKKIILIISLFILSFLPVQGVGEDFSPVYKKNIDNRIIDILTTHTLIENTKIKNAIQTQLVTRFEDEEMIKHAQYFANRLSILYTNYLFEGQTLNVEDIKKLTKGMRLVNGDEEFKENDIIYKIDELHGISKINQGSLISFYLMTNIGDYYFYDSSNNGQFLAKDIKYRRSAKSDSLSVIRDEMLSAINKLRVDKGLGQLVLNDTLNKSAQNHAHDMYDNKFYNHVTPNGQTPDQRIYGLGYDKNTIAENIARGQITIDEVVNDWMESTPHKENILNPDFSEIGIGFDNYYWVQNFGGNTDITEL